MTVELKQIRTVLNEMAPLQYAAPWDNVGQLIGEYDRTITRAMLTIDMTEEILNDAVAHDVDLIITYHPILFKPIQRITDITPEGRMLLQILNHRMCVYSPHTALDAAPGGVTDWLADGIGSGYRRPLISYETLPEDAQVKVVVFVPHEAVDRVRDAMSTSGAGKIGNYQQASFLTPGTGSFCGNEKSNPAIGEAGEFQTVPEVRLEMVCSRAALPILISTMLEFHPYETPAFDLYPLDPVPHPTVGVGRRVVLDQPQTVEKLAEQIKSYLGIDRLKVTDPNREVRTVGFVPGAGSEFAETAIRDSGCELFVTGEMKHHEALHAEQLGGAIILTGHTNSERGFLPRLQTRLSEALPDLDVIISSKDKSRFTVL